jgi:hypothetical protein
MEDAAEAEPQAVATPTGPAVVLLLEKEAAALLNVKPSTLARWRVRTPSARNPPSTPPYLRIGKKVLYERGMLLAWARAQVRG